MPPHLEAVSEFRFIQPCSPVTAKNVPTGNSWVHEVKFDGYRGQAHKIGSSVRSACRPSWSVSAVPLFPFEGWPGADACGRRQLEVTMPRIVMRFATR